MAFRRWNSVAIDVASRAHLAFIISFRANSWPKLSNSLDLTLNTLPKEPLPMTFIFLKLDSFNFWSLCSPSAIFSSVVNSADIGWYFRLMSGPDYFYSQSLPSAPLSRLETFIMPILLGFFYVYCSLDLADYLCCV